MSQLRIIGGKARGRRIRSVPGDATRPITEKVREALFNIIGPDIQGSAVLDLFAGTGSVGIEALSRGAEYVYFVDLNRQAIAIIRENLNITGLQEGATVIHSDAYAFLERQPIHTFDYVYIAPPQYKGMWIRALKILDQHIKWLSVDAWVIVQIHPIEYDHNEEIIKLNNLVEFNQRRYGSTSLIFYRLSNIGEDKPETVSTS